MTKKIIEYSLEIFRSRADLLLILLLNLALVGGFLFYMDHQDKRSLGESRQIDKLADLRIETCHNMQVQGVEALNHNTEVIEAFIANATVISSEIQMLTMVVNEGMRNLREDLHEDLRRNDSAMERLYVLIQNQNKHQNNTTR